MKNNDAGPVVPTGIVPAGHVPSGHIPSGHLPPGQQYNGANNTRAVPSGGGGRLSPGLPAVNRHQNRSAAISPAMSLPSSERSNTSPQLKSHSPLDPSPVSTPKQASGVDPVPKTHASNKRLRKSNSPSPEEPSSKKVKRPNGLSTDATSCTGVLSHGVPSPDNSWMKTRGSFHSDDGSNSCELIETVSAPTPALSVASTDGQLTGKEEPKKRGRKKGSKNKVKSSEVLSDTSREDLVKETMASFGRTPRVKTTQELLANLQAKSMPPRNDVNSSTVENKASLANCLLPRGRGGFREALEMSRNKTEHIAKFLRSQSDLELSNQEFPTSGDPADDLRDTPLVPREDPDVSDAVSLPSRLSKDIRSPGGSNSREELTVERSESVQEVRTIQSQSPGPEVGVDRTVEEILSRLPPVDVDAIRWEESSSAPSSPVERLVSEEDVKRLHSGHIEGLNGNVNHGKCRVKEDGETEDDNFREWHETVSRTSYQGELLHILPYVVID